jgi:HEAT repeat protein
MPAPWREVLEAASQDVDVATRQEALGLLVGLGVRPEPHASRALFDPSPYVRRSAVEALGARLPEPESLALLQDFVLREDVDPYTRGHAGLLLAESGHAEALAVLAAAAAAAEIQWWQAAPLQLAVLAMGDDAVLPSLQAGLARGDFPLELMFFHDCGRVERPELVEGLVAAAVRVEEELVLPIAASLVRLGSPEGEALFAGLLASPVSEARLEALDFLEPLAGSAVESLLQGATRDRDPLVANYARLIEVRRGDRGLSEAIALAEDLDRQTRSQALWALEGRVLREEALGRREMQRLESLARGALEDSEYLVATAAVGLLGALGTKQALSALEVGLEVESLRFRVEVVRALLESQ